MPICIAGMHRSGTSLVAHLLQVCGLHLGEERDLVPAAEANPDGYWEHQRFVEINDELLRVLGGDWATPAPIPEPSSQVWEDHPDLRRLRADARALCNSLAGHGDWGWKDPRNSITLPFWSSLIDQLKVVVSVRHPLEVAASLKRVDPNASIAAGVERWARYYQRVLADAPADSRMLTHASNYFYEPLSEIRRVVAFTGLTPDNDTLARCRSIIRPSLRRNHFTDDELADFNLPREVLALYARMCEESGWDERRARELALLETPGGAVVVEEFERSLAARALDARRLTADARYRRVLEYRGIVRRLRRTVRGWVAEDAPMLVIGRGDDDLLVGPNARHFPQGPDGGYAGYHPPSSVGAIGHLEALRARGADFLIVPATESWWLQHYSAFDRHVRNRYKLVLEDPSSCTIFALRETAETVTTIAGEFLQAVSACEQVLQREPAILDWGTGRRLASQFPDRTVFGPPGDDGVLPYLDRSVDVVAIRAGAKERIEEAERVASTAILIFPDTEDQRQSLTVRWTAGNPGQLPSASLIVTPPASGGSSSPMLRSLSEALPSGGAVELIAPDDEVPAARSFASFCNQAASKATGEILVFLEADAVAVSDWLPPLLRLFRDRPQAGAAGGKVLGVDGRIEYGGGGLSADGGLQCIEEDEYAAGGPASEIVRSVDWCPPVLLATRRAVFQEMGGFDEEILSAPHAAADYCLRLKERGSDVLFQPDSTVVRVLATPLLGEPPASFTAKWSPMESAS